MNYTSSSLRQKRGFIWSLISFQSQIFLLMWRDRVISRKPASKIWEWNLRKSALDSMFAPHRWNVRRLIRWLWVVSWEGTFNFSGRGLSLQTERRRSNAEEDGGGADWQRVAGRKTNAVNTHKPPLGTLTASVLTKHTASH